MNASGNNIADLASSDRSARVRFWLLLVLSVMLSLCAVATVAVSVIPRLAAAASGQVVDGKQAFLVPAQASSDQPNSAGVAVVPATGWWVESLAGSLLVRSPDQVMTVELSIAAEGANLLPEPAQVKGAQLLNETLESGAFVQHLSTADSVSAGVQLPDALVWVQADFEPGSEINEYRFALANLLASIESTAGS